MRDYMNIIAKKIACRRKELGMTQRDLAEKLNVSDKTLSRWETGKQIPDALTLPEIAKVLNLSISEIYGVEAAEEDGDSFTDYPETIAYERITTYKTTFVIAVALYILGYAVFNHSSVNWQYLKIGALVLMIFALLGILIVDFSFEEFYYRKKYIEVYREAHMRWFGSVVTFTGLIIGVVIPALKSPMTTICNSWDIIIPLVVFQGIVLGFYIKRHLQEKSAVADTQKLTGVYVFAVIGFLFSIGFIICVLSNPNRFANGLDYQWKLNDIWRKLKIFELSAGSAFFCMNVLHAKRILGIDNKSFKKVVSVLVAVIISTGIVISLIVGAVNYNLQEKVTYVAKDIHKDQLTDFDGIILEWIQECNLSGYEINFLNNNKYDPKTGETIACYLLYLPHGYEDTKCKIRYQLGHGEKKLKIEFENTTQIMDDNYYLCYLEVVNNGEDFELQAYLDGELQTYLDREWVRDGSQGETLAVTLFPLLVEELDF